MTDLDKIPVILDIIRAELRKMNVNQKHEVMSMRKTKIICTMGPSTDDIEVLRQVARSGMDVARFNFSHGTHEEHKARMDRLKVVREELGLPIAILLDTKGPEIRVRDFKDGKVKFQKGKKVFHHVKLV